MCDMWILKNKREGHGDEGEHRSQLHKYNSRVKVRRFLNANDKNGGNPEDREESNQIEGCSRVRQRGQLIGCETQSTYRRPSAMILGPLRARHVADLRRQADAIVLQERHQRAAPPARNGRRSERVFQYQVPSDDPGY